MGQVRHRSAPIPLPGRALQSNVSIGASFARAAEPGTGYQPQDGGEVAEASHV